MHQNWNSKDVCNICLSIFWKNVAKLHATRIRCKTAFVRIHWHMTKQTLHFICFQLILVHLVWFFKIQFLVSLSFYSEAAKCQTSDHIDYNFMMFFFKEKLILLLNSQNYFCSSLFWFWFVFLFEMWGIGWKSFRWINEWTKKINVMILFIKCGEISCCCFLF